MKLTLEYIETYKNLKDQLAKLETEIKDMQRAILEIVPANESIRLEHIEIRHSQYDQEYFKLKDALESLDKRMLKPFITTATIDKVIIKKAV